MRVQPLIASFALALLAGAGSLASCGVPNSFTCRSDRECGAGRCVLGGCAFVNAECESGLRWGALSPDWQAGNCVPPEDLAEGDSESSTGAEPGTGESGEPETDTGESGTDTTGEPGTTGDPSETGTDTDTDTDTATDTDTDTGGFPDWVLAHYSFDEVAPPLVPDDSGNGFDAEMDNFQASVPGVVGDGLSFATGDRVIVPPALFDGVAEATIEFYLHIPQAVGPRQFLFYLGHPTDTSIAPMLTVWVEFTLAPINSGRVVWTQAVNQSVGAVGTTSLRAGGWNHVAASISAAGMRLYVNHVLDEEHPQAPNLTAPGFDFVQIGGTPTGFGSLVGTLDEVRISAGALEPSQMLPVP